MPPSQPPKKSNALLFILGGCGVLFLLGLVVVAIAGFIFYKKGSEFAKNNPPRQPRTTTTTKPSESGSNGSRTTAPGSGTTVSGLPDWVVLYPGATTENTFSSTSDDRKSGGFTLKTDDSPEKVLDFYEEHMKNEGFRITKSSGSSYQTVSGLSKNYTNILTVTATEVGSRNSITLVYSYKE
jgi:hypothetical protein